MESPTTTHLKVAKRILCYLRGTLDYGLFYSSSKEFKLEGYYDNDWAGDTNDRKSTSGYVFFIDNTAFTWSSKKQPIVTLSICEAEYVAAASYNKSTIALAKNPVFHDRSKHIDTRFHFIRDCISRKEKLLELPTHLLQIFQRLWIFFLLAHLTKNFGIFVLHLLPPDFFLSEPFSNHSLTILQSFNSFNPNNPSLDFLDDLVAAAIS
ncbi:Copia protein [Cucumis melo var. makuwa]|uniref:Copia protein n=1 Tax=Cucumis melo var. makuwa TaxID=1194695 RepID=A0A5A7TUG3_CUCMM|nr:Copia protein [Cucumis melo var. makuwa]TYK05056.1 Copia protein [Cucumis melo var. makuwa]